MNYETESWVKLYVRESTEDKLLPVLNRALRDFLLRLAKSRKDATILGKTESPGEDIAKALGANGAEADTVAEFVRSMLKDGYLSHRRGRLWITNFVEAQEARTPGARRQKTYRDKKEKSRQPSSQADNGAHAETRTDDVSVASHVTSQEIRSEKRREDPSRDEPIRSEAPAPDVGASSVPPIEDRAKAYARNPNELVMAHGPVDVWPEVVAANEAFRAVYPAAGKLRSRDSRALVIVARFADGFTLQQLTDAANGSKLDPHIAANASFQTVATVWRDAGQIDKFCALLKSPPKPKAGATPIQPSYGIAITAEEYT